MFTMRHKINSMFEIWIFFGKSIGQNVLWFLDNLHNRRMKIPIPNNNK